MGLDDNDQKILAELKKKRAVIKASLTRIRTFVRNFDPSEQAVSLLEFRQEELPMINRKFDDVQSQIELINIDDTEEGERERDKFEEDYFCIRSQIQEISNREKMLNSTGVNNTSFNASAAHRTQLAPIPLPKFNGNIQDWASFYDIFRAMVHNDESYTAAQKFYYLRSCLEGQALDLIRSIPISDGNYEASLNQLIQRYDNRSLIIQSHIRSILDCPRVEEAVPNTLQGLYSTITTHVATLRAMGRPVEHWDDWLVTIVTSRLDKGTAQSWQLHQRNSELPKYSDLEKFLASRCAAIERSEADTQGSGESMTSSFNTRELKKAPVKKSLAVIEKPETKCICCDGFHKLFACETFKAMPVSDRLSKVREARRCFNCLSPHHGVNNCKSTNYCHHCKLRHNTLLHYQKANETKTSKEKYNDGASEEQPCTSSSVDKNALPLHACIAAESITNHVFLATASILIKDYRGDFRKCCAVLDSGSQINFISRELANLLQLPRRKTTLPVSGIGASCTHSGSSVTVKIRSRVGNFDTNLVCHVLPVVVERLPPCATPTKGWTIPQEYQSQLADPEFNKAKNIDLLIGGGIFFDLIGLKRVSLPQEGLKLQESVFGWIVTGEVNAICLLSVNSVGRAWDDDFRALCNDEGIEYGSSSKSNKECVEEQQALKHFQETAKRDEEGRFVLRLPLKPEVKELGNSYEMAKSRFLSVERRLQRNEDLRLQYSEFMEEYLKMGHMEEVQGEISGPEFVFYLPHHPVIKPSSLTTKLRVVFDASAKSSTNLSLNDVLMCGPTVQDDIFGILTRFRKHQYVITADVEKMFRQIRVSEKDWNLQRMLWRQNPKDKLCTYQLKTVTYGTTPASFLATQCLVTLAEEMKEQYPEAARAIRRDFYMDDLMTGADRVEDCCKIQREVKAILDSAKLPLRKWCSNSQDIIEQLDKREGDPLFTLEIDGEIVKSLGLEWKPTSDEFQITVDKRAARSKSTKRILLSDLNRVFDPLGFLAPVLIRGKIFLQQLWQLKIEWDHTLPENLAKKWDTFYQDFNDLSCLKIPRKCIPSQPLEVEMHGFCDASEEAYGAVIYIRSKDQKGRWHSRLLCARTRVTPLKGSTIPRLELCGALTLAQLAKKTAAAWELNMGDVHLWTDSMVVLGWLKGQVSRLKTFVANRVNQILEITETKQWRYVRTDDNPADILSRGVTSRQLQGNVLWWNGPHWLLKADESWECVPKRMLDESDLPEQRPVRLVLAAVQEPHKLFEHFSTWQRLQRATAWLQRFVKYLKTRQMFNKGYLSVSELRSAEICILKQTQAEMFFEELRSLNAGKEINLKSKLKSLHPFIRDELILVGGRLENASLAMSRKYPIVLPANHKITRLIFEQYHRDLLHCGPQALLAEVRRKYWPLRGRVMARSVVSRCVKCTRSNPKFTAPLMAPLPKERVQIARPFAVTGVDFAGPIIIRSGIRRVVGIKAWVAVFVCFSTRAVHLEAVEDLSSQAFLASLRRFTARRGLCSILFSDNGTNFVGARRELDSCIRAAQPRIAQEGIEWRFNPPSAPHFGGLWESAVKSAKYHLTRVMGNAKLSIGELTTLLCQIEACINSRPLTPMSSDPSDLEPLTPAHFLIGGPMHLHVEQNLLNQNSTCQRRWKYVQYLMQTFWSRWYKEYLPQLQVRGKWLMKRKDLSVNDIVIVKEDCAPPAKWNLARVKELHPGKDGIVRVVTLQTPGKKEIRRPVVKLCRIPNEDDNEVVETSGCQRGEDVAAENDNN